ncbi:glycosyltransferase, partial [Corynebacterium sp.]|uniref:glycosyltransferase n=1 Tax=Corynebacterium sp. TaxID=1720 RepID=UPI003734FF19
ELDHFRLHRLVASCSVCVVTPQWDEPFGLVAFEAMACGTPVAAFDRGGMGELLRDAPVSLAPSGNVEALAGAIRIAARIDRRHVAAWVRANYSLHATATRYVQLYHEVKVQ